MIKSLKLLYSSLSIVIVCEIFRNLMPNNTTNYIGVFSGIFYLMVNIYILMKYSNKLPNLDVLWKMFSISGNGLFVAARVTHFIEILGHSMSSVFKIISVIYLFLWLGLLILYTIHKYFKKERFNEEK